MLIGITGGIGSGKSTIARELARRGYLVYDCDSEAKRIIAEDEAVRSAIIELLGEESFSEGEYNTRYVSSKVFSDPSLRSRLNAIVHLAVRRDILSKAPAGSKGNAFFIESAILYESGLNQICDRVVYIDAPEEVRLNRTIDRDYHGEGSPENIGKVLARIQAQTVYPTNLREAITVHNDGQTSIAHLADYLLIQLGIQ